MSSEIRFYATGEDWLRILLPVEKEIPLYYYRFSDAPIGAENTPIMSCTDFPRLGYASTGSSIASDTFLICPRGCEVKPREVGIGSTRRWTYDQLINPNSVTFTPAGLFGDRCILYGRIASASNSEFSKSVLKYVSRSCKKTCKKIQSYWVGSDALAKLLEGYRLTISQQSPPKFNLPKPVEQE